MGCLTTLLKKKFTHNVDDQSTKEPVLLQIAYIMRCVPP